MWTLNKRESICIPLPHGSVWGLFQSYIWQTCCPISCIENFLLPTSLGCSFHAFLLLILLLYFAFSISEQRFGKSSWFIVFLTNTLEKCTKVPTLDPSLSVVYYVNVIVFAKFSARFLRPEVRPCVSTTCNDMVDDLIVSAGLTSIYKSAQGWTVHYWGWQCE